MAPAFHKQHARCLEWRRTDFALGVFARDSEQADVSQLDLAARVRASSPVESHVLAGGEVEVVVEEVGEADRVTLGVDFALAAEPAE